MSKGENMVEKGARAICNRRLPKPAYDSDAFDNLRTWAEPGVEHWEDSKAELDGYFADARAVIEALMEPTDTMHAAGIQAMVVDLRDGEVPVVPQIYKAMLHAALSQEGK